MVISKELRGTLSKYINIQLGKRLIKSKNRKMTGKTKQITTKHPPVHTPNIYFKKLIQNKQAIICRVFFLLFLKNIHMGKGEKNRRRGREDKQKKRRKEKLNLVMVYRQTHQGSRP